MPQRLYTVYQVADLLGAVPGEVMGWIDRGWLPCRREPNEALRISERNLLAFLKNRGVQIEQIMARAAASEPRKRVTATSAPAAPAPASAPDSGATVGRPAVTPDEGRGEGGPPAPPPTAAEAVEPTPQPAPPPSPQQLAQSVLREAVARGASAVHLECSAEGLAVRLRVDGAMHNDVHTSLGIPAESAGELLQQLGQLAGLTEGPAGAAHRGCASATIDGQKVLLRAETCPTLDGRRMVLHLPDPGARPRLATLGLTDRQQADLRDLLGRPCGLIVLCGLPPRGPRETLRALAAELGTPGRNLLAVIPKTLRPVEGATCVTPDPAGGLGVAQAIRAAAAQDPDALVLDWLRDPACSAEALEAALEGCLVVGRLHVPTAGEAAALLLDMGLDPWPLSCALLGIIEQATVRISCPHCRRPAAPSAEVLRRLGLEAGEPTARNLVGAGCSRCRHSGYLGRTELFRIVPGAGPLAERMRAGGGPAGLREAVRRSPAGSLLDAGLARAAEGLVSLDELSRVLGPAWTGR